MVETHMRVRMNYPDSRKAGEHALVKNNNSVSRGHPNVRREKASPILPELVQVDPKSCRAVALMGRRRIPPNAVSIGLNLCHQRAPENPRRVFRK